MWMFGRYKLYFPIGAVGKGGLALGVRCLDVIRMYLAIVELMVEQRMDRGWCFGRQFYYPFIF